MFIVYPGRGGELARAVVPQTHKSFDWRGAVIRELRRIAANPIRYVRAGGERGTTPFSASARAALPRSSRRRNRPRRAIITDSAFPTGYDVFRSLRDYFLRDPAGSRGSGGPGDVAGVGVGWPDRQANCARRAG